MMAMLQCCLLVIVLVGCQIHTTESTVSFPTDPVVASIQKDAADGSAVVTVTATDTDSIALQYTLESQDPDTNVFSIDGSSGAITVGNKTKLDYDTTKEYTLVVKATQSTGSPKTSGTTTVSVTVKDGNKAPTFPEALNTACVNKGSSEGTVVLQVTASDEDSVDTLAYSITAGNTGSIFAVQASNGTIKVAAGKTIGETPSSYSLTITATDNDQSPASGTTAVSLDVADPCPVTTPAPGVTHAPGVTPARGGTLAPNFATTTKASFCLFMVTGTMYLLRIW